MFAQSVVDAVQKINVDELDFCKDFDEFIAADGNNNPSLSQYAFGNPVEEGQFLTLIPALREDLINLQAKTIKEGNEKLGIIFLRLCKTEGDYEAFVKSIKKDYMEFYLSQNSFKNTLPKSFEWFTDIMNKKPMPITREEFRNTLRAPYKFQNGS